MQDAKQHDPTLTESKIPFRQPLEEDAFLDYVQMHFTTLGAKASSRGEQIETIALVQPFVSLTQANPLIAAMATSDPLLCGLLCEVYCNRRGVVQGTDAAERIDLLGQCCTILLDRHASAAVPSQSFAPSLSLTLSQREVLLAQSAYWMLRAGSAAVPMAQIDAFLAQQIAKLVHPPEGLTARATRWLFTEELGALFEIGASRAAFASLPIQEFYAARAAVNNEDIDQLVAHALESQWREVVVIAARLAPRRVCERLITGLLDRGDADKVLGESLYALAQDCLSVALEVSAPLQERIRQWHPRRSASNLPRERYQCGNEHCDRWTSGTQCLRR